MQYYTEDLQNQQLVEFDQNDLQAGQDEWESYRENNDSFIVGEEPSEDSTYFEETEEETEEQTESDETPCTSSIPDTSDTSDTSETSDSPLFEWDY